MDKKKFCKDCWNRKDKGCIELNKFVPRKNKKGEEVIDCAFFKRRVK